jgi:hypothetical protein
MSHFHNPSWQLDSDMKLWKIAPQLENLAIPVKDNYGQLIGMTS